MKLESVRASLMALRKYTVLSGAMLMLTGLSACEVAGRGHARVGTGETGPCEPRTATTERAAGTTGTAAAGTTAAGTTAAGTAGTPDPAPSTAVLPEGAVSVSSPYDRHVLSLQPVLYLPFGTSSPLTQIDMSGKGHTARFLPAGNAPNLVVLPNGDLAANFNGRNQYEEVPSSPELSVTHTGCLTVQAWIRPATLQFPHEEGTGYVYILGKGAPGEYEYAIRMYSKDNTEVPVRPNRISGYVWNLAGGLGSGAYFQDPVEIGQWIMVTLVIDDRPSQEWPDGYVALYKDTELRGQVSLSQYNVKPQAGDAPFCIGTRNNDSYFEGAIGKVVIYDQILSASAIAATYDAMSRH